MRPKEGAISWVEITVPFFFLLGFPCSPEARDLMEMVANSKVILFKHQMAVGVCRTTACLKVPELSPLCGTGGTVGWQ